MSNLPYLSNSVNLKIQLEPKTYTKKKKPLFRLFHFTIKKMFYSNPSKSSNFTEASFETPDSCIVTPYNTSASSIVPLL